MDLREVLRSVRRSWILVLMCALVLSSLVGAFALLQKPSYVSTTRMFVSVQQAATVQDLSQGGTFVQQVVQSYADVVQTPIVLNPVIAKLKLQMNAAQLAQNITASAPSNTVVLEVTVRSDSPSEAARIANAISSSLSTVVSTLNPAGTTSSSAVKITQIQPAVAAESPDSPKPVLDVILGLVLGLALGSAMAILRTQLDVRVRSESDVKSVIAGPILAAFERESSRPVGQLTLVEGRVSSAEAFNLLRTNLQFLDLGSTTKVFVITSSVGGEGKSTTASGLSRSIANSGARVLLLEGDLRRPSLSNYMGLVGDVGLTDVLVGRAELADVIQSWGESGLDVLLAGQVPPNPSELLQSAQMSELMERLRPSYDYIIIDAPPLLPVVDAALLTRLAAGALFVIASGRVTSHQVRSAVGRLTQIGVPLFGAVLTMVPRKSALVYGYGDDSVYGYGEPYREVDRVQSAAPS